MEKNKRVDLITKLLKNPRFFFLFFFFLLHRVLTLPTSVCTSAPVSGRTASSISMVLKETLGCAL